MPEIQTKDKLITLEELGVALNGKAGVTGVKGDAEASYRQGNVNLTPADIGAVAVDGTNAMQGWITIDASLVSDNARGIDITMSGGKHWYLYPINNGSSFSIAGNDGTNWFPALTVDMATKKVSLNQPLDITSGGTGATDAAGARNNIGLHAIHRVVITDSDGKFIISFQNAGVTSTPSVCLLQDSGIYDGIMIRYCRSESSSSLVFVATWSSNGGKLINAHLDVQGIVIE